MLWQSHYVTYSLCGWHEEVLWQNQKIEWERSTLCPSSGKQVKTRCPKAICGHRYPCPNFLDLFWFVVCCVVIGAAAPKGTMSLWFYCGNFRGLAESLGGLAGSLRGLAGSLRGLECSHRGLAGGDRWTYRRDKITLFYRTSSPLGPSWQPQGPGWKPQRSS